MEGFSLPSAHGYLVAIAQDKIPAGALGYVCGIDQVAAVALDKIWSVDLLLDLTQGHPYGDLIFLSRVNYDVHMIRLDVENVLYRIAVKHFAFLQFDVVRFWVF